MSEKKNPSRHSAARAAPGDKSDRNATVDSQNRKKFEIRSEGAPDATQPASPQPPPMEDVNATTEIDLHDALKRLEQAEETVRNTQDDILRVQAEMQNLRRRTEQDIEKAHKYGQERFVTELLSVVDNLERALEAARLDESKEQQHDSDAMQKLKAIRDGVELTLRSFQDCFRKFNVESFDPLGEPFDPQRHQAMATVEDDKVEPNTVTVVVQKGYLLHGRVIRPAMVMVSK